MSYFYILDSTGTGINPNFYEPNLPYPLDWKGERDNNSYLIATYEQIDGLTPLTDAELQTECITRNLDINEVKSWLM